MLFLQHYWQSHPLPLWLVAVDVVEVLHLPPLVVDILKVDIIVDQSVG